MSGFKHRTSDGTASRGLTLEFDHYIIHSALVETEMTKHVAIDESRLKAAVQAIKERKRPDIDQINLAQHSKIAKLRRDLGRQFEAVFADAGFDISKFNQIVKQHQADVRLVVEKQRTKISKELAALTRSVKQGLDNQRKAIEWIATKPFLITPIPIVTPFFIYALPAGMLNDSHTEPLNNWAKLTYTDNRNIAYPPVKLSFYFAWQNPVTTHHARATAPGFQPERNSVVSVHLQFARA